MLGTNFIYVLMRKDGECYKIGHSSRLKRRLISLNKNFGPFSSERSFAIRADTKSDAARLEDTLKAALKPYRFTLPVGRKGNGQTEWFTGPSFELLLKHRDNVLSLWIGEGSSVESINLERMAPLSGNDVARLNQVRADIRAIQPQLTLKWENPEKIRKFRTLIKKHRQKFLGVAKTLSADGSSECFEIFLEPDACSKEELDKFPSAANMGSSNARFFAQTNLWTSTTCTREYQKLEFRFQLDPTIHEESWESAGYIHQMYSLLKDLCDEHPLPAKYRQYIGVSFFDRLSEQERSDVSAALRQLLFGGMSGGEAEKPARRSRKKARAEA